MAQSINQVTLLGSLGRDSETKFTPSGMAVTNFSIATNRSWKDKASGEWKEETDWHNIVAWGKEKVAEYLLKGVKVCVQGSLRTRSYDDKNGVKKYVTEVVADNIILLGDKQGGDRQVVSRQPVAEPEYGYCVREGDIPF